MTLIFSASFLLLSNSLMSNEKFNYVRHLRVGIVCVGLLLALQATKRIIEHSNHVGKRLIYDDAKQIQLAQV